jgi:hypothetical protein
VHTHTCTYACYAGNSADVYIRACMLCFVIQWMYTYEHACMHAMLVIKRMYTCMYMYIHAHIHIHTTCVGSVVAVVGDGVLAGFIQPFLWPFAAKPCPSSASSIAHPYDLTNIQSHAERYKL